MAKDKEVKEKLIPHVIKTAFTNLVTYLIEGDTDEDAIKDIQILGAYIFGEESVKELYPTLFNSKDEDDLDDLDDEDDGDDESDETTSETDEKGETE